jgi:hypothetical protein
MGGSSEGAILEKVRFLPCPEALFPSMTKLGVMGGPSCSVSGETRLPLFKDRHAFGIKVEASN